ncbi:MAG: hypothetical protein C4530_07300 [Desulfobacteraceae bacterium]|nr:MAG: hypothetical protein C4530_07300 [Desulfobacteraceae bacterium]
MTENRHFERFKPSSEDKIVELYEGEISRQPGRIQDISRSGVFIWKCYSEQKNVKLKFVINSKKPIFKDGSVIRKDTKDPWMVVDFKQPLSEFELCRITCNNDRLYLPGDNTTYDLAQIDRREVFREANQIKTCASNYFTWSIGSIIPFTTAIWALVLMDMLNAESVSSSMIGIVIVFSAALFSNIEKSRAINKREGFIAALDYYLRNKTGPQNYRGWVNLKHCFGECRARVNAHLCPLIENINEKRICCQQLGENKSRLLRENKKLIPSILDSFICLTSFFYAVIFFGISILTLMSFSTTWRNLYSIKPVTTVICFSIGFIASLILLRNFIILVGMMAAVLIVTVAGVIFTKESLINASTLGIGAIIGGVGWFFFSQLFKLRKGVYSVEAFTHTWLEIFENCIFLPDDAKKYTARISFYMELKDKIRALIFGKDSR